MTTLRIQSGLPADLEDLAKRTIGALLAVHRELGSGMSEGVYAAATRVELGVRDIPFESEKTVPVRYRGKFLCHQRIDLFLDGRLVVELKSVDTLHPVHFAQVVSYLRLTGARLGLLVNFNVPILAQGGVRRVIL
jgi:GxxExxY protein